MRLHFPGAPCHTQGAQPKKPDVLACSEELIPAEAHVLLHLLLLRATGGETRVRAFLRVGESGPGRVDRMDRMVRFEPFAWLHAEVHHADGNHASH